MKTIYFFLFLIVIVLSCQTKLKQETETTSITTPTVTYTTALLAKRPAPGSPRSAADRLVRALYFEHNKKENPFRETNDQALVEQFFAKPTVKLIRENARKASGKVNRSKINLLFNAPDASVKKTWVEPAAVAGTRAVVYVTFEANAKPGEIKIDLQQVAGRWRITDMRYPGGKRLTELMQ